MSQHLGFLLLGLGSGAVYAALGLALVMTFRSSGVVNFGTGAIALYAAYTYAFLRQGQLLDPIPGLPVTIHLGTNSLGFWPAAILALVIAALIGMLLYAVVFRPLRAATPTAKAVASIGVLLALQALLAARVGTSPISVQAIFPTHVYRFLGTRVPGDRIWFSAVIVLLTALAAGWSRWTRFGLATRAAAESEKGAIVTGLSPGRIGLANWAVSSSVAGLSGILIAPIVPLVPGSYTLFVVPALAAALVGSFDSLVITVAAGFVIGMLQSEMSLEQSTVSWLPSTGMVELVSLAVIVVFLLLRGRSLPTRGAIVLKSLGVAPRPLRLTSSGVAIAAVGVIGLAATHGGYRAAVITSITLAVVALSQVVVTGYTGQISLAQLALVGVGAFTLSRLQSLGIPFPVAPILAAVVAMVVGVVIGLPALRLRGLAVAAVTLALAVAVQALWFTNQQLDGGFSGAPVKAPALFGWHFGIGAGRGYPHLGFGIFCLLVLLLVAGGVAFLRRSRLGAAMLAVRANERSAAAAGIAVARVKVTAFAVGGFIAGLAGSLYGYQQTVASGASFDPIVGIALFATVYLAGVTSISGGLLAGIIGAGGLLYVFLNNTISLGPWYATISGLLLIVAVVRTPEGIAGQLHAPVARLLRRVGRRPQPRSGGATAPVEPAHRPTLATVPAPADQPLLEAIDISVSYGGVKAVDKVSVEVGEGEILGVIGPNGAGKTTFIDAVSGFASASGRIRLAGIPLDGLAPHRRVRAGLGRTFQGIELYDDLTVFENVEVGSIGGGRMADVRKVLTLLDLHHVADETVRNLSQGRRQLVSVARAMAGSPSVVCLDEPAAGLDTSESTWLGARLRAVRDAGTAVLIIDHDMGLMLELCDRLVVLDLGRVIATGTPAEVRANPEVARAYLGSVPQPVVS